MVQSSDCVRNICRWYFGVSVLYDFKRYYVDDSRGQYRFHPILFRPLSLTIDYLSTETFQFHVESTVWDCGKEDLLTIFCYFAPVIRHSVQTMCTMFSRKDFFRLFGGLLKISTRKTNAEPRCLTSLDGHDGGICAAKHLELVHAHHLTNPYTDLTNSIWGKNINQTCMSCPY